MIFQSHLFDKNDVNVNNFCAFVTRCELVRMMWAVTYIYISLAQL